MTLEYDMERLKVLCDQMAVTLRNIWPNAAALPEWMRHRLVQLSNEVLAFRRDAWPVPPAGADEEKGGEADDRQ